MAKNSDKFNFFIPATFEKGTNGGKEEMRIKGIASSEVEDSDGETLVPAGYDLTPLLQTGFLNYNHKGAENPSAIIGEPTVAKVINNGKDLYIEGFLYSRSKIARDTFELAKTLEANSPTRRMGFSIEGKVLEKDSFNPKRITKARITGVAITPSPKNPNTLLSIVKGEYDNLWVDEEAEVDEEFEKAKSYPIDTIRNGYKKVGEGKWRKVSKHGLMKEEHKDLFERYRLGENMEAAGENKDWYSVRADEHKKEFDNLDEEEYTDESVEKAMTAAAAEGVTQTEDVDGGKKAFDSLLKEKKLTKSQVYSAILNKYGDFLGDDLTKKAKDIFLVVQEFNNKLFDMKNGEILEKALDSTFNFIDEQIDLIKGEKESNEKKDADEPKEEETSVENTGEEAEKEEKVEKGESFPDLNQVSVPTGKYGGVEVYLKNVIKGQLQKGATEEEVVADLVEKGLKEDDVKELVKGCLEEMNALEANGDISKDGIDPTKVEVPASSHSSKSPENPFNKSTDEVIDLIKGEVQESLAAIEEKQITIVEGIDLRFKALGNLLKSQADELANLRKSLGDAEERLQAYASQPTPIRSVTSHTQAVNRFPEKIEKSETGKDSYSLSNPSDIYSLTQKLSAEFDNKIAKGDHDRALGDAVLELTIAKSLDTDTIMKIGRTLNDLNIHVVQ